MDSVTQIALGAAIGGATLGRTVGRRAILWGALCGTLPDLDVFVPFGDPVKEFTYHRSFSHSLFVLTLVAPLIAWLILKLHPSTADHRRRWLLMVWLALVTHPLLDSFTVYGTQLFWPFSEYPVSGSTLFIIDPAYTLPLLAGVIAALALGTGARGRTLCAAGLAVSSAYLVWSVGAKLHVEQVARDALQAQNIRHARVLSTPAAFNTLLWRLVVMDERGYYEGWYSLLDRGRTVTFTHYPSDTALLRGIEDTWAVQRLQWFTHGFYSVSRIADHVIISDLRMGWEPEYVFRFAVARIGNPHPKPVAPQQLPSNRSLERLRWILSRIRSEQPLLPDGAR
jgi:inner membrane protein